MSAEPSTLGVAAQDVATLSGRPNPHKVARADDTTDRQPAANGSLTAQSLLEVTFGGASLTGPKPINQDAFAACAPRDAQLRQLKGCLMAIADGISAGRDSQIASQMAVVEFIDEYLATPRTLSVRESALRVLRALNAWLFQQNLQRPDSRDHLLTTFTAGIVKSRTLHLLHTGDSRLYLLRDGRLRQLTADHRRTFRGESVLYRALGGTQALELDLTVEAVVEGDILVLSTDGLHDAFTKTELVDLLQDGLRDCGNGLEALASALVDRALRDGSNDNATCLLCRIESLPNESVDEAIRRLGSRRIPPVLRAGMRIDDLDVLRVLHGSPRSHLYEVRRRTDGRLLVLKVPSLNFSDDAVYLDAFVREHWLARQFEHPNLIRGVEPKADSDFLYMLCEPVPGQTLRQWMIDHPQPSLEVVRKLLDELVAGLRFLHRNGVIHRDFKPENVMVDDAGCCRIIDLGSAQVDGLDELGTLIREDRPAGSVNYIAPEYLLGQRADAESDLFSLACVAYELLAGHPPYEMESRRLQRPRRYGDWHYRSIRSFRPDLPRWIDIAFEKATAANPRARYAAYSEFVRDLRQPGETARRRQQGQPLLERNPVRFWQLLSLILGICLIVAVAY